MYYQSAMVSLKLSNAVSAGHKTQHRESHRQKLQRIVRAHFAGLPREKEKGKEAKLILHYTHTVFL